MDVMVLVAAAAVAALVVGTVGSSLHRLGKEVKQLRDNVSGLRKDVGSAHLRVNRLNELVESLAAGQRLLAKALARMRGIHDPKTGKFVKLSDALVEKEADKILNAGGHRRWD